MLTSFHLIWGSLGGGLPPITQTWLRPKLMSTTISTIGYLSCAAYLELNHVLTVFAAAHWGDLKLDPA